ncbi:MAG: DUF1566 domain-containing protein [Candidatus Ozemobacteraceae bacterium]
MRKFSALFVMLCLVSFLSATAAQADIYPSGSGGHDVNDLPALEATHFKMLQKGQEKEAAILMEKEILPLRAALESILKRFVDNGNGTITDTKTALMWAKNANLTKGEMTKKEASKFCKKLELAGFKDWAIPSFDELESLLGQPVAKIFSNIQLDNYWSDSYDRISMDGVCLLNMRTMDKRISRDSDDTCFVIPVRDSRKPAKTGWFK